MPSKGRTNAKTKVSRDDWQSKVHRIDFSPNDETEILLWAKAVKPIWTTCLEELIDSGFAIKISPPSWGDDYWVSCTAKANGSEYSGHTFSVVYPDMQHAIILSYWCMMVGLPEGRFDNMFVRSTNRWLDL